MRTMRWLLPDDVAVTVHVADTFVQRLIGLLGTSEPRWLWFPRCRAVHTLGMRYAIDVAYFSAAGEVVGIVPKVPPRRLVQGPLGADSVLECGAGEVDRHHICLQQRWPQFSTAEQKHVR